MLIGDSERIRSRSRNELEVGSAINFGYFKNGATPGKDSIVGIDVGLLGCPGTVEEFA